MTELEMSETFFWLNLTVYHEARGESPKGKRAVVKVIMNRGKKNGWPVSDIVNARKQFSCYNKGINDPSLHIKNIPAFLVVCKEVELGLQEWFGGDTLEGSTHYYAIEGMVDKKPPYWADSMDFVTEIENHRFLREK